MINHEQPSSLYKRALPDTSSRVPYVNQPHTGYDQPYQRVNEDTLKTVEIQVERKLFILTLKENPRGRFLRITEDVAGRHNTIIIPSTGLVEFKKLLAEMVKASDELPPKLIAAEQGDKSPRPDQIGQPKEEIPGLPLTGKNMS